MGHAGRTLHVQSAGPKWNMVTQTAFEGGVCGHGICLLRDILMPLTMTPQLNMDGFP